MNTKSSAALLHLRDKIERAPLPSVVTDLLREQIIEGRLAPGTRLNERELCEQFGISRTPLREAFQQLAFEDLIEMQPNRGARVTVLSETDIRESFTVLGSLETLAGQLACQHATDEETREIIALTHEMKALYIRHDLPNYYKINRIIHSRIIQAARNSLLEQVHTHLNRRVQSLRFRSNLNQEKWTKAMEEHQGMSDALAQRDGERLGRLLATHLHRKCDAVLEALAHQQTGQQDQSAPSASA